MKKIRKISTILFSILLSVSACFGTYVACGLTTGGGGNSQSEITDGENSSENGSKSSDSTKNVDNSGNSSTGDVGGESTAVDLDIFSEMTDDDGNLIVFWISDTTFFSIDWLSESEGTESDPYQISSAEDLAGLSYLVFTGEYTFLDCYFEQTCDIDVSGTDHNSDGLYWMPIGVNYEDSEGTTNNLLFMGSYDGNKHTVSGIKTCSEQTYVGLFGYVGAYDSEEDEQLGTAVIHDLGIVDSTISGGVVGAIAGMLECGDVYNCFNSCTLNGTSAGGIIGSIILGYVNIYNCYNTGSLTSSGATGGIVGAIVLAGEVCIYNCYNSGDVTGDCDVGGIVGGAAIGSACIYSSFNTGSISGSYDIGGVVGEINLATMPLYNCFNVGDVTATSTDSTYYCYVGGLVGYSRGGSVSYCYYGGCTITGKDTDGNDVTYQKGVGYDYSTSAEGVDASGVAKYLSTIATNAKTESWYTSSSNWDSTYPWDFESVWDFADGENDGYPILNVRIAGYWINYYSTSWLTANDGTESDPYIIDSAEDLAGLSYLVYTGEYTFLDCYFKQTCDIDLSGTEYNEDGLLWTPIGFVDINTGDMGYFMGNYDGDGHIVSGVSLPSGLYCAGLFGAVVAADDEGEQLGTASVHDLGVVDSSIESYYFVGAVVGMAAYAEIYNCYSTCTVAGTYYVGGVAGVSQYASVYNCCNTGKVIQSGSDDALPAGGICGAAMYSDVYNCYNTGTVTGVYYVGGIVGMTDAANIYNCYNKASTTGTEVAGGIVGFLYDASTLYNCFNVGDVTATSNEMDGVGGVVGGVNDGTIAYCYYGNCTISDGSGATYQKGVGYDATAGAEGEDAEGVTEYVSNLTTLAKTESWYADLSNWNPLYYWDFDFVWAFADGENDGYPVFDIKEIGYWIDYYSISWLSESEGTESDPYIIDSAEDLAGVAYLVNTGAYTFLNCYFEQTCDIDLSGKYWTPIGFMDDDSGDFAYFMGNYDGGSHIISGLLIRGESYVGLFGAVVAADDEGEQLGTASVHDLGIENSTVIGTTGVGAVAGAIAYTEIYNCYNTGSVTGTEIYIGGIVGAFMEESTIYNCYNSGSVAGVGSEGGAVGGIVGYVVYDDGNISNCYNTGLISGCYYVGGIVGFYEDGSSIISNCYNIGTISGVLGVGGLFGVLDGSVSVYNCFNVGNVTASLDSDAVAGGVAGGIIGSSVTISNCYYGDCTIVDGSGTSYPGVGYDESTDAVGVDASGVVECLSGISTYAKTLSWFTDSDNWDSTYAWDFSDIWRINSALNDGYPVFSWQSAYIYDEDGGYWYFEDGYMPQSVVSDSDLIANLEASAELTGGSYVIGSEVFSVWAYDGEEYIKVTASGANGTADDSDCTWFVVEPIRWIVAYGSADEAPTEVSTAVSALVVTLGAYTTTSTTNWTFRSLYTTVSENSSAAVASGELSWSEVDTVIYDYLVSSVSQVKVKSVNLGNADSSNTTVTRAGYRVASAYEIDGLGGTYSAKCSDLVAFLLSGGTSTDGDSYSAAYWTRDLAVEMDENSTYYNAVGSEFTFSGALNNGVYVTANGTLSNAKLSNSFGARLSMSI